MPSFLQKIIDKSPFLTKVFYIIDLYGSRRMGRSAAAFAYYLMLSFFPLLICVASIIGRTSVDTQELFRQQVLLAKELGLPVIIHDREAHADTLEVLRELRPQGVLHCFSGSAEMAREAAALGMYMGFTGAVTFKNARKAPQAAAAVPDDRLLIETDCPYMAPEPYRGKRCDSSMLPRVAERLAEIRGCTAEEIVEMTCRNAKRLFGIA